MAIKGNEGEEASSRDGVHENGSRESQHNLGGDDSLNALFVLKENLEENNKRLSKVENDNIKVMRKLDDIAAALRL